MVTGTIVTCKPSQYCYVVLLMNIHFIEFFNTSRIIPE